VALQTILFICLQKRKRRDVESRDPSPISNLETLQLNLQSPNLHQSRVYFHGGRSKTFDFSVTRLGSRSLTSLKENKEIRIPQADKGNCTVVLNEPASWKKISILLEPGVCELYIRILHCKLRGRYGNVMPSIDLPIPLV
jgi:hypothetical protein